MKMINKISKFIIGFYFISNSVLAASLSDTQKKELIVFGIKAMGTNANISDVRKVVSTPDIYKMVSVGLLLNGHLCAKLLEIRPLMVKSTYEATCIAYRNGTAKKTYIIDSLKGIAFIP